MMDAGKNSLHWFRPGPAIPSHELGPALSEGYAEVAANKTDAEAILTNAVAARLRADAGATVVRPHQLPNFDFVGAQAWWARVFDEARKHGPRMLAALLLEGPPEVLLPAAARRVRSQLLASMKTDASLDPAVVRDLHDVPNAAGLQVFREDVHLAAGDDTDVFIPAPDRQRIYEALAGLLPVMFDEVVRIVKAPSHYLPGRQAEQSRRADDLVTWAFLQDTDPNLPDSVVRRLVAAIRRSAPGTLVETQLR